MKASNDEIETIQNQLNGWNEQLSVLALKQELTEVLTAKLPQEIGEIRTKQYQTIKQLGDLELHQSGMYIWENIGCGG